MSVSPIDRYHRHVDYLRLSVTDRCNLRCTYCMPEEGVPRLAHEDILTYEEILRLVKISIGMGITKVRITGGEPLVRKGILRLCRSIARLPDLQSISLTTNGVLLESFAQGLFEAGIHRINVSLDTLRPERYAAITRRDQFDKVWRGILEAQRVGFYPVKLNVVMMRGVNDDELEDLASLTFRYPFHVRFIEFMPLGGQKQTERFLGSDELLDRLRKTGPMEPVESLHSNGPAQYFRFAGAEGKVGVISPVSHHFCATCNRLRLTADGKLRTCLFATEETDLKTLLRSDASNEEVRAVIQEAIRRKPERYTVDTNLFRKCLARPMSAIGG